MGWDCICLKVHSVDCLSYTSKEQLGQHKGVRVNGRLTKSNYKLGLVGAITRSVMCLLRCDSAIRDEKLHRKRTTSGSRRLEILLDHLKKSSTFHNNKNERLPTNQQEEGTGRIALATSSASMYFPLEQR